MDADTPTAVVMCGLPGVGKSTVARYVAEERDAEWLRSDVIRKELFDEPEYTSEESQATYDELFRRAGATLGDGRDVVLDATFSMVQGRDRAVETAEEVGADAVFAHVVCDEEVVERRIAERDDDPSDADFEVYKAAKKSFDPIDRDCVTVDNSGDADETRRQAAPLLGRACPVTGR